MTQNKIEVSFGMKKAVFYIQDNYTEADFLEVCRKVLRNCGFSYRKSLSLNFSENGETTQGKDA